ncbi:uncharacterized protein BP5553_01290 [Venustampulla echinocandica]|uniref:P-loop containing nucleoside triphosphate hydrolase n=1 Tax=Venustampulla echinocandica TaxID=2656787 RepID=A0A370U0K9_9HELO|nr:uncharacterized protein BP5553_01290 [Venustampulla echinocandica]RDL41311.1 hypothetical protein BP5553_01290 [Venustampulla echinocandica]
MAPQNSSTMAENTRLVHSISDAQASILDLVLFPGFTRMSTAIQGYLTIDLSVYVPLMCFFGLVVFVCRRIWERLLGWLETHFTSTIHVRYREEDVRSSLATTDLASASTQLRRSNDEDTKRKTIFYTPWNGRFFIQYHGHLIVFRREHRAGEFNSREEVSLSCFSRSLRILRQLLTECCVEYSKLIQGKTSLYEHQNGTWARSMVSDVSHISTVALNESVKKELLKDIGNFLNQTARRWYSNRGFPYRRGYLLYRPPGTGKSSLSLSIAGYFGLDIYILSLSAINEDCFRELFAKLLSRCVILVEDIDAVSSKRSGDAETNDSRPGSLSQQSKSVSGKVFLSALLNVIDSVGSQEGWVLIMTTNHITYLDEAFIRPGRVDKKVELGLADKKMTANLFCLVFKPVVGDVALPDAQSGEDKKVYEAVVSQREEAERVERAAKEFATRVPELKFSRFFWKTGNYQGK